MEYDGINWYMNSEGYYRNKEYGLLHRYIWTKHNGEIPKGYIIHHDNEDKTDNTPKNLIAMTNSEHTILHNLGNTYTLGKKHTEETKLKIGLSHKGNKYNLGKKHTEETKQKISESSKGKIISDETKKKMSESSRGESSRGENNGRAKLTNIDVMAIKTWILLGYMKKDIAKVFNVSGGCISSINTGRKWSHINL